MRIRKKVCYDLWLKRWVVVLWTTWEITNLFVRVYNDVLFFLVWIDRIDRVWEIRTATSLYCVWKKWPHSHFYHLCLCALLLLLLLLHSLLLFLLPPPLPFFVASPCALPLHHWRYKQFRRRSAWWRQWKKIPSKNSTLLMTLNNHQPPKHHPLWFPFPHQILSPCSFRYITALFLSFFFSFYINY